jgi:hypothetical protein
VSCPSRSFCAAIGNPHSLSGTADALTFNGTGWSTPVPFDNGRAIDETCANSMISPCLALSCPRRSFCIAADNLDHAVVWNGRSWSRPATIERRRLVLAVSCASPRFCVATDSGGYAIERKPVRRRH